MVGFFPTFILTIIHCFATLILHSITSFAIFITTLNHCFATLVSTLNHCFVTLVTTLNHCFSTLIATLDNYFATLITTHNHCFANLTLILNNCFSNLTLALNHLFATLKVTLNHRGANVDNGDQLGREIYDGNDPVLDLWYHLGAQAGLLGLVLKSIVFALMSFAIKPLGRYIGGARRLWGDGNLVLAICLSMIVMITKVAEHEHRAKVELSGPYANMPPFWH
ncbi:hypothetical protein MtrunA17_Chr4g0035671 [Medicago truncatula]|uniref:Transmembrane protein n=1 Tax=Medicago truncatula TaxID=3880 RepID=A0A396I6V6_MEDTR|nr:hypothetical protein MtrunA17_Chr4g0035671 [Medicago truncatula]